MEAIVLLGCKLGPQGTRGGAAGRRCERAARAWHAGLAPLVVCCGGRRWDGVCEATALRDGLVERGVPAAAVRRECRSLTTAENARHAAQLLLPGGARSIGLVTCDFHMARALLAFRACGLDPVALPAPSPPLSPLRLASRTLVERGRRIYYALML